MNLTQKLLLGIGSTLTLGLAASSAWAQTGPAAGNTTQSAGQQGVQTGDGQRMNRGKGRPGAGRGEKGLRGGRALLTPEERTAFREKMRGAKTPEERQQIAMATRAEVEKRAKEKGITLPERGGMRGERGGRNGRNSAPASSNTPPSTLR